MATYNAQQLMAGFSAFTTAREVAAGPIKGEGEGLSATTIPTTPISTSATTTSTTGTTRTPVSLD